MIDAHEKAILYAYICEARERSLQTNWLSPEEGIDAARICASALTDAIRIARLEGEHRSFLVHQRSERPPARIGAMAADRTSKVAQPTRIRDRIVASGWPVQRA